MSVNNTTIQLRVDKKTKDQAQRTLNEIGLDFSSAIKLFLRNIIITESIPFEIRTKNGFTRKQEEDMIKESELAVKHGRRYKTSKELHRDLI